MSVHFSNIPNIPRSENEVSDRDIFAALDPDWPGLEGVMAAYQANKMEEAKKELIHYFYNRKSSKWFFDYREQPDTAINPNENRYIWGDSKTPNDVFIRNMMEDADLLCQHQFKGGVLHDLGDRWDQYPLFNMNEADNKPLRVTANRFNRMNFLNSLAIAYHQSQDQRYIETFVQLLESFLEGLLEQHPYVPDTPKSAEAYTLHFSRNPFRSNMSMARSALNIINIMYTELFYSDLVPVELSFRLFRYAWYVMLHHRSYDHNLYRHYNHHLFERGMMPLFIGIMFPEFPLFRPMLERGRGVIWEHLEKDFHPSGGYDEHSFSYTCDTTLSEFLVSIKDLADLNGIAGFDQAWSEDLHQTYTFYSSLVLPDGKFPDIGDGGGGPARLSLKHGERLYHNKTARAVLRSLEIGRNEAGLLESEAGWKRSLPPLTINDPLTGYVCSRENWTSGSSCMVMCNKVFTRHCSHNHLDMLSLILVVQGETLIGEPHAPVLYKYVSNQTELDAYMRGSGSHNTVLVQGEPITKSYLWERDRLHTQGVLTEELEEWQDRVYVRASHDAYTDARHTREVMYVRQHGWWINDTIVLSSQGEGGSLEPHIQRWHVEHGVQVESAGTNALLLTGVKSQMLCIWPVEEHVSLQLWRNEAILQIDSVPSYKQVSDLPWIIDVCFQIEPTEQNTQLQCIFVDVTNELANLQTCLKRSRELLRGARLTKELVNLK